MPSLAAEPSTAVHKSIAVELWSVAYKLTAAAPLRARCRSAAASMVHSLAAASSLVVVSNVAAVGSLAVVGSLVVASKIALCRWAPARSSVVAN